MALRRNTICVNLLVNGWGSNSKLADPVNACTVSSDNVYWPIGYAYQG
jgi:hypothetical protein